MQVLQAFRPSGGTLRFSDIMRRTGLPKSTVHRLIDQLVTMGMLVRSPDGYSLGVPLFELSELVPVRLSLREAALPFMQDLYEATHQTVHLGVLDGLDVVYAEKISGHSAISLPSRVGGRLPLNCTGVGKALLAFSGEELVSDLVSRPLRRLTDRSITDPGILLDELARTRASGFGYDREEAASGVCCIAAPILVRGMPVAALSVAVPASQLQPAALAPAVRTACLALARRLPNR